MPRVLELDVKVREPPGIEIGGSPLAAGKMAVLSRGASLLRAGSALHRHGAGGESRWENLYWNFASSSQDGLRQAAEDWKADEDPLRRRPGVHPDARPREDSQPDRRSDVGL